MTPAELLVNPVSLNADVWTLLLVLPLCALVTVVYKTVGTKSLRRLPLEIAGVMAYIVGGLVLLGLGLYLTHSLLA